MLTSLFIDIMDAVTEIRDKIDVCMEDSDSDNVDTDLDLTTTEFAMSKEIVCFLQNHTEQWKCSCGHNHKYCDSKRPTCIECGKTRPTISYVRLFKRLARKQGIAKELTKCNQEPSIINDAAIEVDLDITEMEFSTEPPLLHFIRKQTKDWNCPSCKYRNNDESAQRATCLMCSASRPIMSYIRKFHYLANEQRDAKGLPRKEQQETLFGRLGTLLGGAMDRTKKLVRQGRVGEQNPILTLDDLVQKWYEQKGLCYYSGVKLELISNHSWLVSCERLNPARGYSSDNVVLVAYELNGQIQMSCELLQSIIDSRQDLVCFQKLEKDVKLAHYKPKRESKLKRQMIQMVEDIDLYSCLKCDQFKAKDMFSVCTRNRFGIQTRCKSCTHILESTLATYVQTLYISSVTHSKGRANAKYSRGGTASVKGAVPTISEKWILEQILKQGGRCKYTDAVLSFTSGSAFQASLERLDNTKSYCPSNVVLVILAVNTAAQWSKDKFNHVVECFEAKKARESNVAQP